MQIEVGVSKRENLERAQQRKHRVRNWKRQLSSSQTVARLSRIAPRETGPTMEGAVAFHRDR
jgi:hypothetical protein